MNRTVLVFTIAYVIALVATTAAATSAQDAQPTPQIVDTPTVKVLKGLTAPEFEIEMQQMTVALGVNCGFCHVRGNFASEENPHKAIARRMLEMTGQINQRFFPGSRTVTCFTCHQGEQKPKTPEA